MEKIDFNKLIGKRIRKVREQKGLTQNEVALLMDMDAQNFSKYERGLISPTVYWIHKYCKAVKCDFGSFMELLGNDINA